MPYLIDSDWVIDHLADQPEAVQLLRHLSSDGIAISIITYLEAYQGVCRVQSGDDQARAESLLTTFVEAVPIIFLSPEIARRCARLRDSLKRQGKRVNQRSFDLLNAATALEHGLTLVTRNRDDYDDIADLSLYPEP
jgi:predicted nucleic acid-binding protein